MDKEKENTSGGKETAKVVEQTLLEFVESLFEGQGQRLTNGDYSIEMVGEPKYLVVHLYDNKVNKSVEVCINGSLMGYFTRYTGQGYQYRFQQHRRPKIRMGRTTAEQYMEDTCTCHKDKVLLWKAY